MDPLVLQTQGTNMIGGGGGGRERDKGCMIPQL